jgi:hypothetical protein
MLSGNQTGSIVEVSEPEGEHLLMSQLAELAPIEAGADPVAPVADAEGGSLAEPDESNDAAVDPDPAGVPATRTRKTRAKTPTDPTSRRKRR